MKLIHKVADCGLCPTGIPATYDEPLAPRGTWGNVCDDHHAALTLNSPAGYRLTRDVSHPDLAENKGRDAKRADIMAALDAGDLDAAEDILGDGDLMDLL